MDWSSVVTIARKEVRDALRNRWFILYTIGFAVLSLALSYLSLAGTGRYGFAGFGRTTAGLVNLVLLVVPLMTLTISAGSIAGERERRTLEFLLSQPVGRFEVLLGKFVGLALSLFASISVGFGFSAVVIASLGGGDPRAFVTFVALTFFLSLAMLSLGLLISVLSSRATIAVGVAVILWLALVFLSDLGLIGSAVVFKLQVIDLFRLSLINPVQVFKMAAINGLPTTMDVLGPAGLYAQRTFGSHLNLVFCASLTAWVVAPLALAAILFRGRSQA
ncbi:MAG: ABC transporter permease subunit [Planctomycetota bacterium]